MSRSAAATTAARVARSSTVASAAPTTPAWHTAFQLFVRVAQLIGCGLPRRRREERLDDPAVDVARHPRARVRREPVGEQPSHGGHLPGEFGGAEVDLRGFPAEVPQGAVVGGPHPRAFGAERVEVGADLREEPARGLPGIPPAPARPVPAAAGMRRPARSSRLPVREKSRYSSSGCAGISRPAISSAWRTMSRYRSSAAKAFQAWRSLAGRPTPAGVSGNISAISAIRCG